jgi:hypothetical protein
MIGKGIPRVILVVLESSVEEYPRSRRQGRGLAHIENEREIWLQRSGGVVRVEKTTEVTVVDES